MLIRNIRKNRVLLAGLALIVADAVCLYLSDAVARSGSWWQGTLDAFGVGFIVGGMIDVLAITALNQVLTGEQRRQDNNLVAEMILKNNASLFDKADAATQHLIGCGRQIDPADARAARNHEARRLHRTMRHHPLDAR